MDIQSIFFIIKEHIWKIILTSIVACVVSGVVSFFFLSPVYSIDAKILINKQSEEGVIEYNDVLTTQKLANTYGEIIRSRRIANIVSKELGGYVSKETILNSITVIPLKDSQVLKVSVTGNDPQLVKQILSTLLEVFRNEIGKIMRVENVEILDDIDFDKPLQPIKPKPLFNIIVAGVATAVVAIGFAIFLDFADPVLRSVHAARRSFKGWVFDPIPASALIKEDYSNKIKEKMKSREQYDRYTDALRKIRAQLVVREGNRAVYMIASPHRGIATQRIAFDFGKVFAESGDKTLYIVFNGSNIPTIVDCTEEKFLSRKGQEKGIEGEITSPYNWEGPIQEIQPFFYNTIQKNLYFLGLSPCLIERELLFNQRFIEKMLLELKKDFHTIIVAPSISMYEVSDALIFQPYVNSFLLIMEKFRTSKESVKEALNQIQFASNMHVYGLFFDIDFYKKYEKKKHFFIF